MRYACVSASLILLVLSISCRDNPAAIGDQPFEPGGGTVRLAGLSDCAGTPGIALAEEITNNLMATVSEDGTVSFVHSGAMFNCCLDSVGLEMYSWGGILRILEIQHCERPCRCTCGYSVHGEISNLEPGYYTLEICGDSLGSDAQCSVQFRIAG